MKYILAKWSGNWADEMDLDGFRVFTQQEWDEYKTLALAKEDCFTFCVGTNEEIEYENGQALLNEIKLTELGQLLADTVNELFIGKCKYYGFFPSKDLFEIGD